MLLGIGTNFVPYTTFKMPSLTLSVGETSFSLENLDILTESLFYFGDPASDGALGMDFIRKFSKVTLNLNKMFIKLEE